MSIYDSILQQAAQGYAQANQNQMAIAQMPTFADKFLAGLRQAKEDEYKRQMAQSQLDMNQAYKQSQSEHYRQQDEINRMNRQREMLGYISKEARPENYDSLVAQIEALGGNARMVPKVQMQDAYEQIKTGLPSMSETEGGEEAGPSYVETQRKIGQIPVPGTGYGTDVWQKIQERANKFDIASMNVEQRRYHDEMLAMEPKSAAAKLTRDFILGKISPEFYHAMQNKMSVIIDPMAAAKASQGDFSGRSITNAIGGESIPASPSNPNGTTPGWGYKGPEYDANVVNTGGPGIISKRPTQQAGAGTTPGSNLNIDPNSKEGVKRAIEGANELKSYKNNSLFMTQFISSIDNALSNTAINSGFWLPTKGQIRASLNKDLNAKQIELETNLETIGTQEALSQLRALKNDTGTGIRMSVVEWNAFLNAVANINKRQEPSVLQKNLAIVKKYASQIRDDLAANYAQQMKARGLSPETTSPQQATPATSDFSNHPLLNLE